MPKCQWAIHWTPWIKPGNWGVCSLTSQVQVSLRGCGASCWSWYTEGGNTGQWTIARISQTHGTHKEITKEVNVYNKANNETYSKTSTPVAGTRHDLRAEKGQQWIKQLQHYCAPKWRKGDSDQSWFDWRGSRFPHLFTITLDKYMYTMFSKIRMIIS